MIIKYGMEVDVTGSKRLSDVRSKGTTILCEGRFFGGSMVSMFLDMPVETIVKSNFDHQ
jgi:hypothetical protein